MKNRKATNKQDLLEEIVKYDVNILNQKLKGVYVLQDKKDPDKETYLTVGSEELFNYQRNSKNWLSKLKYSAGLEDFITNDENLKRAVTKLDLYIDKKTGKPSLKENTKSDKDKYKLSLYILKEAKENVDHLLKKNHKSSIRPSAVLPYVSALLDATLLYGHKRGILTGDSFGLIYDMKKITQQFQESLYETLHMHDKQKIYQLYWDKIKIDHDGENYKK